MKLSLRHQGKGFTIVELMIATAVFSMVLLICAIAIMHVGQMYYKGMIVSRTQDTSRKIADDVTAAIQFGTTDSSGTFYQSGGPQSFPDASDPDHVDVESYCFGTTRYSVVKDKPKGPLSEHKSPHVFWKDTVPAGSPCDPIDLSQDSPVSDISDVDMTGDNMRVPEFHPIAPSLGNPNWGIILRVAYGETDDLFVPADNGTPTDLTDDMPPFSICKTTNQGGQFCAVSNINISVGKRL